ncbi:uncharacterized protein RHO17_012982 isoform 2-T4 [Thomomys bottae]
MSECANTGRWAPQSARTGSVCEERRGSQAGTSAPWEEWGPAERGPRVGGRVWVTEVGNLEVPSQTSRSSQEASAVHNAEEVKVNLEDFLGEPMVF